MARDAADLARKLQRAGRAVGGANNAALSQIGVWGKGVMIEGAAGAGLRPGGSFPRGRRSKWGARFEMGTGTNMMRRTAASTAAVNVAGSAGTAGGAGDERSVLMRYVGPVHWAFRGTKPHLIVPGGRGRARRQRAVMGQAFLAGLGQTASTGQTRMLKTPYGPRPYVMHPGTKGRNTWPATKARLMAGAPRMWAHAQRSAVFSAFTRQ